MYDRHANDLTPLQRIIDAAHHEAAGISAHCARYQQQTHAPADHGRGPQGDVQRAANYVRLVRDVDAPNYPLYLPLITMG